MGTEFLITVICLGLVMAGVAGTILPMVPGASLILAGGLLHFFLVPGALSWVTIAGLIGLTLISVAGDYLGSWIGARMGGASVWGMAGAVLGLMVGFFFGPLGWIFGPFLGAFLGEWLMRRRNWQDSSRAGAGATLGFLIALAMRLGASFLMAGWVIVDLLT